MVTAGCWLSLHRADRPAGRLDIALRLQSLRSHRDDSPVGLRVRLSFGQRLRQRHVVIQDPIDRLLVGRIHAAELVHHDVDARPQRRKLLLQIGRHIHGIGRRFAARILECFGDLLVLFLSEVELRLVGLRYRLIVSGQLVDHLLAGLWSSRQNLGVQGRIEGAIGIRLGIRIVLKQLNQVLSLGVGLPLSLECDASRLELLHRVGRVDDIAQHSHRIGLIQIAKDSDVERHLSRLPADSDSSARPACNTRADC